MTRGVITANITEVRNAVVAIYQIPLDSVTTETKGTVLLKSADELKAYNTSEEDALEAKIRAIKETGVNVLVCGSSVGELALHFVEKYKMMLLKVPSKFELRRVCRTTGAENLVRMDPPQDKDLGFCKRVHVEEIGSTRCTLFDHEDDTGAV